MKKKNLLLCLITFCFFSAKAQTLLTENAETGVFPPTGWTTIETPEARGHWTTAIGQSALNGNFSFYIDELPPMTDGGGARQPDPQKKEFLITPAITLPAGENYGVRFLWQGQSIGILDRAGYDFKIAVSEDNGTSWDYIWSAANKEDLEASGIKYPWPSWSRCTSTVSLKDYKGKTVKIAFVYELMIPEYGNMIKLDDISVIPHNPIETPIVTGSTAHVFGGSYIGVKHKSATPLYLSNQGVGELKITAIEGLAGTDFSTDLDPANVSITSQDSYLFNVYFTPTETGGASTTMTIKTNGGDHNITLSGSKIGLDPGYTVESFDGVQFPPAGWAASNWNRTTRSNSGEYAVTAAFTNLATLTSPRLSLPAGNHPITFDYQVIVGEETGYYPENDFYVELTRNGGTTWSRIWISDDYEDLLYTRKTIQTGNALSASENCYIRWVSRVEGAIDFESVLSNIYIDNVVLPPLYGANSKPGTVNNHTPASDAVDQYINELLLSWGAVIHAEGYKLYLGTNASNPNSVLNGITLGKEELRYEVDGLTNNTIYYWKVVPFNAQGDAENVETWAFKTMEDKSISTFPYFNGFEDDVYPPVGWTSTTNSGRGWDRMGSYAYDGNYSLSVFVLDPNGYAILQAPDIVVPATNDIQISFVWGNALPAGLTRSSNSMETIDGDSIYFEVKTPGTAWTTLAFCSQESGSYQWVKQRVSLADYKGQRISVRWRYHAVNISRANRAALDNVEITYASESGVPVISFKEWNAGSIEVRTKWNAGILNFKETKSSGEIFILDNEGNADLEVESTSFDTPFFQATNLPAGTVIAVDATHKFGIGFTALSEQVEIKDTLRIQFVDGQVAKFAIEGSALPQNTRCYTFDNMEAFTTQIPDFKTIDVDAAATVPFMGIFFPGKGSAMAYQVLNWEEADWRNIYPRSGKQVLAAYGADNENTEVQDWLISKRLTVLDNAKVRFYAKSYASNDMWNASKLSVLVSTTTDAQASFVEIPAFTNVEIPAYADDAQFMECSVDLSAYSGQQIYVAIRHKVSGGLALFIDDLYFENFQFAAPGNQAPVFLTTPPTNAVLNAPYIYNFSVTDPDSDVLTITVKGKPTWLNYTPGTNSGTLSGTPTVAENYFVVIEVTDGEFTISQQVEIDLTGTGINIPTTDKVVVYPNPVTSRLHIATVNEKVVLTDLAGKQVLVENNATELAVDALTEGIYILKIYAEDNIYTTKIIKK